jgi:hypothetical protein
LPGERLEDLNLGVIIGVASEGIGAAVCFLAHPTMNRHQFCSETKGISLAPGP